MGWVKGLEFDRVWILPSESKFDGNKADAEEEARLIYVGMTRAKQSLSVLYGDRERACWDRQPYSGRPSSGRSLSGTPDECFISWSWLEIPGFNDDPEDCQAYIERHVRVGDRIDLRGNGGGLGRSLYHQSSSGEWRQVGFLSDSVGSGSSKSNLMVSAVIRYRHDPENPQQKHKLEKNRVARQVLDRGWGYLVLVSGVLRASLSR